MIWADFWAHASPDASQEADSDSGIDAFKDSTGQAGNGTDGGAARSHPSISTSKPMLEPPSDKLVLVIDMPKKRRLKRVLSSKSFQTLWRPFGTPEILHFPECGAQKSDQAGPNPRDPDVHPGCRLRFLPENDQLSRARGTVQTSTQFASFDEIS